MTIGALQSWKEGLLPSGSAHMARSSMAKDVAHMMSDQSMHTLIPDSVSPGGNEHILHVMRARHKMCDQSMHATKLDSVSPGGSERIPHAMLEDHMTAHHATQSTGYS